MKKYFVILCVALMPLVAFTSCSDDDDPPLEENLAEKAAGDYNLKATVTLADVEGEFVLENVALKVSTVGDSKTKVSFDLAEVNFTGAIYDFEPFEITLSGTLEAIKISQKDIEIKVERKDEGNEADYEAKLSFEGTIVGDNNIKLTVTGMIDDDQVSIEVEGMEKE